MVDESTRLEEHVTLHPFVGTQELTFFFFF